MQPEVARQAGAPEETEITPEMIEAGASALEGSGAFEDRAMTQSGYEALAEDVIRAAMARATRHGG